MTTDIRNYHLLIHIRIPPISRFVCDKLPTLYLEKPREVRHGLGAYVKFLEFNGVCKAAASRIVHTVIFASKIIT
ncbi:hypothetical protein BABINDRAFT_114323 [Babjeviella inositovora NRRL Y-12698]|uniref:Uncharacterized protein n=1 Tax=Babjeviella inositovora NRRL Y-12698 TaxID=984486 RepID=A0A1E3QWK1_9ASCO|nr:uncharacterized protein BABINDRAFT_114323 [Babjeviella inositovora NRRL Y-12698]ODQ82011.1 hypothetical protein BABINDRAFT_114323 [Babjeviella inositovora NRRL Y-12698]